MGRSIIGVIVGVLAGVLVISLIQMAGHMMYPTPEGVDMKDPAVVTEYMKDAPFGAIFMVLVAYVLGAFVAGLVSTLIGQVNHIKLGLICGVILLLAVIMTLYSIPHPMWFMAASIVLTVPVAIFGAKLATKK